MNKQAAVSDVIRRVMMVPPTHFTVEYRINPWMGGVVDKALAMKQWQQLKHEIEKEGVEVLTFDQVSGLPDMVFSCNSGIVYGNQAYLAKLRNKQRAGEQRPFAEWYQRAGFRTLGDTYPEYFEGGGDAVFSDYNTLWAGYGFRSDKKAYDHVKQLGDFDVVPCKLINDKFYHLDTCFCPIGSKSALYYPKAFTPDTVNEIKRRLPEAIAVSDVEAAAFVCNAIAIRRTVISPIGIARETREALSRIGYGSFEVDMSEFIKSGGACQCLVLKL